MTENEQRQRRGEPASPETTDEQRDAFRRGAEAMRRACIFITQPLGNYSNTPEMQERLRVRCEITQTIQSIDVESLADGK